MNMIDTSRTICNLRLGAMFVGTKQAIWQQNDYNKRVMLIFIINITEVDCKFSFYTISYNYSVYIWLFLENIAE